MTPLEAAVAIREATKSDPDLASATTRMVRKAGCDDIYDWCKLHPDKAVLLAEQVADIDGQIANMSYLLSQGDLS